MKNKTLTTLLSLLSIGVIYTSSVFAFYAGPYEYGVGSYHYSYQTPTANTSDSRLPAATAATNNAISQVNQDQTLLNQATSNIPNYDTRINTLTTQEGNIQNSLTNFVTQLQPVDATKINLVNTINQGVGMTATAITDTTGAYANGVITQYNTLTAGAVNATKAAPTPVLYTQTDATITKPTDLQIARAYYNCLNTQGGQYGFWAGNDFIFSPACTDETCVCEEGLI